jgi:DNA polymerase V
MFALVDCNSCYASCEQIFRPDLRGKPVVVLSNNDGCIIARSKEAKALGIPDLHAFFQVEQLLRQSNVEIFSANFTLYGDISHRVMTLLKQFSPEVEVYSIDEMFLQLQGFPVDLKTYGQQMKSTIWKEIKMPVCVGIAPTKTLAKLANHAAKKIAQVNGVCVLDSQEKWQWVQKRIAVNKIWGIGSRTAKKLNLMEIVTAYDLAVADAKHLRRMFNVNVERTIKELRGVSCLSLEDQPPAKQQIYCTRSFGDKPTTLQPLETAISAYASRAAEKLRAQQHLVNTIQVFINTSPYEPGYYSQSQVVKLPYPTDDTRMISSVARQAVRKLYRPNKRYLKAGIGLLELSGRTPRQNDLFHAGQPLKTDDLMQALDRINNRYGQGALYLASEGAKQRWRMRQQFLSPAYTTRWPDIPSIKC